MKLVTSFLPYVMPYVMGCPKPVARRAIVDAAIEFCEKSMLVQQTLDPFSVEQGQPTYDLYVDTHQLVFMPVQVWFKSALLKPQPSAQIANAQAYRQDIPEQTLATGDPREYFSVEPNVIGLYPVPAADLANALTVRAAVRPKRGATQLADVLYDNWVETVADGALMRLHGTPGQAYSDEGQRAKRRGEFYAGLNRATIEASRGRVPGELRVTPNPFS